LIVVYVLWSNAGAVALSDSRGNSYASAAGRTTWGSNGSAQIFYAKNIAAGANTVAATFATAINSFGAIHIHEYSGVDKLNPVDVTRSATGTGSAMRSGPVATTNATDLLFAAAGSARAVKKGDRGYTTRSAAFGDRTQDRNVSTIGSYDATATQNGTAWVMQLVAFKAERVANPPPPPVPLPAPPAGATVSAPVTVAADAA